MSVLSFPRIYFTGLMCWDPATGNNNDYFPTYADAEASLNWPFLKKQVIDQANYRTKFRPWVIDMHTIDGTTGIPGEWNYFGGNGCYFLQFVNPTMDIDRRTLVTGGALAAGQTVNADPMFGKTATLLGDPFGDPEPKPPGRLVDVNPVSVYSSQIYYHGITFGDATTGIVAPRAYRMQSRYINFGRNLNLPNAGIASVTWQASFPAGQGLKINVGQSQLLAALQAQIASGQAKGIMVRFNTYLNLYYQNGYFNDFQPQPTGLADLPPLYKTALATGTLFSNPCYSRVVGVIGPWYDGELATAPEGRYLSAPTNIWLCDPTGAQPCWQSTGAAQQTSKAGPSAAAQAPSTGKNPIRVPPNSQQPAAQLGIALAQVDYQRNVISIDVLNTFPEQSWKGEKANFKDITIGVQNSQNVVTPIATLTYAQYAQHAYETGGGIVDVPFDAKLAPAIRDGLLVFQVQPGVWVAKQEVDKNGNPFFVQVASRTVMAELPLAAQTDQRGVYLNEGGRGEVQISVKNKGKPAAGAFILCVKYNPPDALGGPTAPIPVKGKQVVNIVNGQSAPITLGPIQTIATTLQTDANGNATLMLQAESPGFPVIAFYPYLAGQAPPPPLATFSEALTAMFTSIRVLSYDDAFVDQFVQLWNSTFDPAKAWDFVYANILYLYDMIFPVMLKFVPLGDRQRVEGAIDQVLALIAPSYFVESTLAMPITRDLSRGKRTVLELWGGLVKKNYPPQPISKPPVA